MPKDPSPLHIIKEIASKVAAGIKLTDDELKEKIDFIKCKLIDGRKHDQFTKWYLSTEGYYFKYREDRNDSNIIRATLYKTQDDSRVVDVRVSEALEWGIKEKSHHDLINYFEVFVSNEWI